MPREEADKIFTNVKTHKKLDPYFLKMPGGQSLNDLSVFARSVIDSLHRIQAEKGAENILLITHGEFMKVMTKILTNDGFPDMKFNNCEIMQFQTTYNYPQKVKNMRVITPGSKPSGDDDWKKISNYWRYYHE